MKYLIFIMGSLILIRCNSGLKEKEYRFSEIGWTIKVPLYFDIIDSVRANKENEEDKEGMENKDVGNIKFAHTTTLLYFLKGDRNYLSCTIRPYDTVKEVNYTEHIQFLKNTVYNTLKEILETNARIDTSSSKQKIGSIQFYRFKIKMRRPSDQDLTQFAYWGLVNGYSVEIAVTYVNEKIGEKILSVLDSSKFIE